MKLNLGILAGALVAVGVSAGPVALADQSLPGTVKDGKFIPARPAVATFGDAGAPACPRTGLNVVLPIELERAAKAAGFDMKIHPHMLRHACGYKLANDGVDTRTIQSYLGHRSIQHTVRYTELAPTRFKSLFRD